MQLLDWLIKEVGPIAKLKDIHRSGHLLKTRSSRIMRSMLRRVAKGEVIAQAFRRLKTPPFSNSSLNPTTRTRRRKHHTMKRFALCVSATLLVIAPFAANANKALAEKNGCLGCHAAAVKLVGPAYKDVAA